MMGSVAQVSIDQWLANVSSPKEWEARDSFGSGRQYPKASAEDSRMPRLPAVLETLATASPPRQPLQAKHSRDEPGADRDSLKQSDRKKQQTRTYDRHPRRKTREDRYEYQATRTPAERTKGRKMANRTNTSRRSRKQTMNAGFHASNVARNRLTLPPLATVGIFSKGKSSSPIQLHQGQYQNARDEKKVPTEFMGRNLSFRQRKTHPSASTSNRNTPELLKPNRCTHSERWTKYSHDKTSSKQDTNQVKLRLNKSINTYNEDTATIMKPKGPHNILSSQQLLAEADLPDIGPKQTWNMEAGEHCFSPKYRSATPYTWSVSEHRKTQIDNLMESTLLAALQVSLEAGPEADEHTKAANSGRRYYELKDLREILEARKVKWTESVSIDCSVPCSSALPIPQSDYAASMSPNGQRAGTYHVKNMNGEDPKNDEQILQQLDLLLQEIVTPRDGESTCEGERLEIPPPRPGPLHVPNAEFDSHSSRNAREPLCNHHHMSPCNKIAPEDDNSASLRETYSIIQTGDSLRPSSICNNKGFPSLHLGEYYIKSTTPKQKSGQTEGSSSCLGTLSTARPIADPQTTIPLGFWRQNKLY